MPGFLRKSPSSMSHRRQSFCFTLSLPLLLSKSPHHARESVERRKSPSIIGGADGLTREAEGGWARGLVASARSSASRTNRISLIWSTSQPGGFRSFFLEIDTFHRDQRIPVRRGRSRHAEQFYIRFCFPDTATADAFRNRFGGECLTHAPGKPKPRPSKHVPAKEPG